MATRGSTDSRMTFPDDAGFAKGDAAVKTSAFLLAVLCGCAAPEVRVEPAEMPDDYAMVPAKWLHGLDLTYLGPGDAGRRVISSIRDSSAIRYMVVIGIPALDTRYVATQPAPDGSETETLAITLRAHGEDEFYVDFEHTVRRADGTRLRFAGTTLLPCWMHGSDVAARVGER
jgi:hypothetical protein